MQNLDIFLDRCLKEQMDFDQINLGHQLHLFLDSPSQLTFTFITGMDST